MAELEAALTANDVPPHVHLLAKPGRITQDELMIAAGGERARYSPFGVYLPTGDPGRISPIIDGRAAVQDEGSQLVALALASAELDGPDRRWLDLAAGPGGKAALLGAWAAQVGARVDAVEVTPHRAELVRKAVAGLPVAVHTADGRDPWPAGGRLRPGTARCALHRSRCLAPTTRKPAGVASRVTWHRWSSCSVSCSNRPPPWSGPAVWSAM